MTHKEKVGPAERARVAMLLPERQDALTFYNTAARLWNVLPADIYASKKAKTLQICTKSFETHLFRNNSE